MALARVKRDDLVQVLAGRDRGKRGKVRQVITKSGRAIVADLNIVKKHRRARTADEQSGIIEMAAPIHASNVMLLDPKTGEPTRTRRQSDEDGTKERIAVKSGEAIPRTR